MLNCSVVSLDTKGTAYKATGGFALGLQHPVTIFTSPGVSDFYGGWFLLPTRLCSYHLHVYQAPLGTHYFLLIKGKNILQIYMANFSPLHIPCISKKQKATKLAY